MAKAIEGAALLAGAAALFWVVPGVSFALLPYELSFDFSDGLDRRVDGSWRNRGGSDKQSRYEHYHPLERGVSSGHLWDSAGRRRHDL